MKNELRELERRAQALGFTVEREDGAGGDKWLAVTLPGDKRFTIALHHVYGGLHVNLQAQSHNSLGLLAEARRIADAHHKLMQCPWCGEEGIHAECAKEETALEAEKSEAKLRETREYAQGAAMDRIEGVS